MFEIITGFLAAKGLMIAGVGVIGVALNFLLKRFMTVGRMDWIGKQIESFGYGIGVIITAGLSKWPYTSKFWNVIIEPYIVLIVLQMKNLFVGLAKGLESDNPSLKE